VDAAYEQLNALLANSPASKGVPGAGSTPGAGGGSAADQLDAAERQLDALLPPKAPDPNLAPNLPIGVKIDKTVDAATNTGAAQQPATFPDQLRAWVKNWPVPANGMSMIGTAKDLVEGFAELLEATHGDLAAGQDISPKAKAALSLFATPSPAAGSGAAIARAAGEGLEAPAEGVRSPSSQNRNGPRHIGKRGD
jgi:hypothetical protein